MIYVTYDVIFVYVHTFFYHIIIHFVFSLFSDNVCNLQVAFIPFIVAGDPDLATTLKALKVLDACGSDVIELGVPYSDPLADGPVIQVCYNATYILYYSRSSTYAFFHFSCIILGFCYTCAKKRHHI